MNSERIFRPTYRSLSKPLTVLGVERKLFLLILLVPAALFQAAQNLMPPLAAFLILLVAARAASKKDPQFLRVLIANSRFVPRYDPAYQEEGDR